MAFGKSATTPFAPVKTSLPHSLVSVGSQPFVCNKNSNVLSVLEPYSHFGGTLTYDANSFITNVPRNALYLDLYHLYPGLVNPTTALKVRVYGSISGAGFDHTTKNLLPGLVDSTRFNLLTSLVIPLEEPVTGLTELTFDSTPAITQSGSGNTMPTNVTNIGDFITPGASNPLKTFSMSPRKSVFLAGADAVIVLVSQAASGNSGGNGVVLGRFVS